ncbi:FAD-dependent monooxygenase [Aquimarina aquimarini]|uniref:FAD-dependent monooxygenase n=1 Tax=Aquimarina aquimarini TaxID=1191734 RepID=UPI000D55EE8F|nr:FAD-dependent monooxygenase [Aquimarina aquimarini]
MTYKKQHAIVLGGSLGGLMTARVLSDYYKKVTIVEKNKVTFLPETRKGQSHTKHLHYLQYVALSTMLRYYPNLEEQLLDHGAIKIDWGDSLNYYSNGGYKKKFTKGIDVITMSRPLLEHLIRENTLAISNIELRDQSLSKELLISEDKKRVTGVLIKQKDTDESSSIQADLVVDTTGRGSSMPKWLKEIGYDAPKESKVKINLIYSTRIYDRDPKDPRGNDRIFYKPTPPKEKLGAGLMPVEGNRWMLTQGGCHGSIPSTEHKDILEFLKGLPCSDIYDIISKSEPLGEAVSYKFKESLWRHYEKLNKFPVGLLVLGDAIFSFNPIYAQGMTSASLQVAELDKLLKNNTSDNTLASQYFKEIKKIGNRCWSSSTGEDFRYPETTGKRPLLINLTNTYLNHVIKVSNKDRIVSEAFLSVAMMLKPPISLFNPRILWRLIKFI